MYVNFRNIYDNIRIDKKIAKKTKNKQNNPSRTNHKIKLVSSHEIFYLAPHSTSN